MDKYLFQIFTEDTKYVNYSHPAIQKKIQELFNDGMKEVEKAKKAYTALKNKMMPLTQKNTELQQSQNKKNNVETKKGICSLFA